jgi:hypothetical protein
MIEHCFNPQCNQEFRYLGQGSVYQWERGSGQDFRLEFFWLCPACAAAFRLTSDARGIPSLAPRSGKAAGKSSLQIRRVFGDMERAASWQGVDRDAD